MKEALGQIKYRHNNAVRRQLCAKAEDGFGSMATDDSAIRAEPLRIDQESLPVPKKFLIRHAAFMPTQSRGHGTRPRALALGTS
jgi:hypothetical protein